MKNDKLTALKKDAARYRYLKDSQNQPCRNWSSEEDDMDIVGVIDNIFICTSHYSATSPNAEEFDAYIDCAMLLFPNK